MRIWRPFSTFSYSTRKGQQNMERGKRSRSPTLGDDYESIPKLEKEKKKKEKKNKTKKRKKNLNKKVNLKKRNKNLNKKRNKIKKTG